MIGNSHLAILKLGWPDILAMFADMELDFYAAAGGSLALAVSNGCLVPADDATRKGLAVTSAKSGDIEPGYSAYVLCGLMLRAMTAVRAFKRRLAELHSAHQAKAATDADFDSVVFDALRDTLAIDVLRKLRVITAAPVFLIATPLPAYERHPEIWDRLIRQKQNQRLARVYNAACDRLAREFGAIFLPQPPETIGENGLTTPAEYYLLPIDYVRTEKAPHTHMNQAYGGVILRNALQEIRAAV
jgi:hypothetical protein